LAIADEGQFGLSGRSITVSTVGVAGATIELAKAAPQTTLALSLHAPSQALRAELVPAAASYPLPQLLADAAAYFESTGRRVTFEYVLLAGVNDLESHGQQLVALLRDCRFPLHVNLLPWNPVADAPFSRPDPRAVELFARTLASGGIAATVRTTRGMDAAAACGQLRNERQAKKD
jgi:23S rRNA (adenine2503-C2)-methyltransferase